MPSKKERHEAIRERAREALRDMYHNGTLPNFPSDICSDDRDDSEWFESWLADSVSFEIDYLNDGGAYARTESAYRKTLEATCNAGRYTSPAARAYYVRKGMRDMRRERSRCNSLDSRTTPLTNAMWEYTRERFGQIYQWGRGGRTVAPESLIRTGGGSSFGIREDYFDDSSLADCVEGTRIVESFNAYCAAWCNGVPQMWREQLEERQRERDAETAREIEESRPDMHP